MPWKQLSLEAGEISPEALSDFLDAQGALSVTLVDAADQPLFEPDPGTTPLWSSTRVTAMFDADAPIDAVRRSLAGAFGADVLARLEVSELEDRDWERAWLDSFRPMRFGERVWICPAGQRPAVTDATVVIDLDPGLAFGTGTHPTTALCLEWLDGHAPRDMKVLDYGCGSGVLAIAALKLGARSVWGVDIDEQALWASRENAVRNAVDENLTLSLPQAVPEETWDLLLANILANPLIELAASLAARVSPGGTLVLSGILEEQAEAVQEAYRAGFVFGETADRDGWVRLTAVRRTDVDI